MLQCVKTTRVKVIFCSVDKKPIANANIDVTTNAAHMNYITDCVTSIHIGQHTLDKGSLNLGFNKSSQEFKYLSILKRKICQGIII